MTRIVRITSDFYETEEDRIRRKQSTCGHGHWVKKCSHCGAILDSDHLHEDTPCEEIVIST